MNIKDFLNKATLDEISRKISELASSKDKESVINLKKFLIFKDNDPNNKQIIPYLACRGLLHKEQDGVRILMEILNEIEGFIYPISIVESLWSASNGKIIQNPFHACKIYPPLNTQLSKSTIEAAKDAFYQFVIESYTNIDLFDKFSQFLYMRSLIISSKEDYLQFPPQIFSIIYDSTIKITQNLLTEFYQLVDAEHREEVYQKFLERNPVLIDPLSFKIINKHQLGNDLITDFVIETLKNEYILVEIEKPQDKIFTQNGNFSSVFSHAFGQVLDFIDWIDNNTTYAQKKLPDILNPKGLLIIGRSRDLNTKTESKLKRFNKNSNSIEVLTYDDIIFKAKNLYKNLRR